MAGPETLRAPSSHFPPRQFLIGKSPLCSQPITSPAVPNFRIPRGPLHQVGGDSLDERIQSRRIGNSSRGTLPFTTMAFRFFDP